MITRFRATALLVSVASVTASFAAVGGAAGAASAPPDPAPATGHSQVVAQAVIEFSEGPSSFRLSPTNVAPTLSSLESASPAFLLTVGDTPVIASDAGGVLARLAPGEAMFRPAGTATELVAESAAASIVDEIAVVAGTGEHEFTPGSGQRDVDLVRDVMTTNEALVLRSEIAVFVVVTEGTVNVSGTELGAGTATVLTGDVTMINTEAITAHVAAVVVGPVLGEPVEPPLSSEATSDDGSSTTTPPSTTAATTTSDPTATTDAEPVDTDSDGLSDADEDALGTDPNNADTDGDGIPDGREVNSLGSNPLDTDTDSDGLTDALEVDKSCNINAPDSDGDGLGDAFEANSGFSECSLADTDGDGDDDLAEFSLGTDPRDPDCFSGPGSVCL